MDNFIKNDTSPISKSNAIFTLKYLENQEKLVEGMTNAERSKYAKQNIKDITGFDVRSEFFEYAVTFVFLDRMVKRKY